MRAARVISLCAACALASCSSSPELPATDAGASDAGARDAGTPDSGARDSGTADAGAMDAGPTDAGPMSPLPFMTEYSTPNFGVIASPKLITITFSDDPNAATLQAFDDWVASSTWLSTVGADYGVGTGTNQNVPVADTAAGSLSTYVTPELYLKAKIADGTVPAPTPSPDGGPLSATAYVLYYPSGVSGAVQAGAGGIHSCDNLITDAGFGPAFQYAVIGNDANVPSLEVAGSHEIIESLTDPCTHGYEALIPPNTGWSYIGGKAGSEVGDLCPAQWEVDLGTGYYLQRAWSNSAVLAGTDPCIPSAAPSPYFNVTASPAQVTAVPAGQSATYVLTGWSPTPVSSWTLSLGAQRWGSFNAAPVLGGTAIGDGETVTVTLTVPSSASSGQWGGVLVYSGPHDYFWPVVIVAQ